MGDVVAGVASALVVIRATALHGLSGLCQDVNTIDFDSRPFTAAPLYTDIHPDGGDHQDEYQGECTESFQHIVLFFLAVLGVDGLDFLAHEVHVVLQLLHLAVHLVDERVALLRADAEETEVVLVGLNLLLHGLILTE